MIIQSTLFMTDHQIKDAADPEDPHDVVNKKYIDARIASWSGTRFFAVSTNGNDNNLGYSDISTQDAMECAVASVEKLSEIIPRIGAGTNISIAIESGNYGDMKLSLFDYDQIDIFGIGPTNILGKYLCLATNELNFIIKLGNINGSNADLSGIDSKTCRIRFDQDTITSNLRNVTSNIFTILKNDRIHITQSLKIKPSEEDIIFIEQPGTVINNIKLNVQSFSTPVIQNILGKDSFSGGFTSTVTIPQYEFCFGPGIK